MNFKLEFIFLVFILFINSCSAIPTKKKPNIKMKIKNIVKDGKTPGIQYVAVTSKKILINESYGLADIKSNKQMNQSTQLMAYSMTKIFIAVLALRLQEKGKLSIEDNVSKYLPALPYGSELKIKHLINQTSGIPSPIPLKWAHSSEVDKDFNEKAIFWKRIKENPELDFAPGDKFKYSNLSYATLGQVIETITAKSLFEVFQEEINGPLGISKNDLRFNYIEGQEYAVGYLKRWSMINFLKLFFIDSQLYDEYENGWLKINRHNVDYKAMGGLIGNAKTVAIFLQDLLKNDSKLLNSESKKLLFTMTKSNTGEELPMTFGWHIGELDNKVFYFKEGGRAGYHCEMRVYPEHDLATVVMSNSTTFDVKKFLNKNDHSVTEL